MKRIIAFLMLLGLTFLISGPAMSAPKDDTDDDIAAPPSTAQGQYAKEEVVYAHMGSDGGVDRVFVVNAFRGTSGQIVDFGDYVDVVNLSNSDNLYVDGDRVTADTVPGDFYFQGESAGTQLPWLIAFAYLLDGRAMSADELRGSSGDLTIRVSVKANAEVDPVFFDHYMLQISVNLDSQYFSSIVSEGATIAANGTARTVSLTSMPGTESEFTITAVADNAHLGQIQIAGLPFELAMELPDPQEYVGDLVALQDAIAVLADGVGQFTDGVDQLGDANAELSSGAAELADNAQLIARSFDRLTAGRGEFDAGLRRYNAGVQEFATGMGALTDGLGEFTDGIARLADGSSQLASGLDTYSAGMDRFSVGLNRAAEGGEELTDGLSELGDGLRQLTDQGKYSDPNLVGGSAQILEALEMLDAALSFPMTEEELDLLLDLLQTLADSLDEISQTVDETDLDTLMTLLRDALTGFDASMTEIEQIADSLQDGDAVTADLGIDTTGNPEAQALLTYMAGQGRLLEQQTAELRAIRDTLDGLDPLIEGLLSTVEQLQNEFDTVRGLIHRLNESVQAISLEDLKELINGLELLSSSYREFHEGLVAYVDGVERVSIGVNGDPGLLSGSRELSDGLGTLASSGGDLADGAADLADGANALNDGIGTLKDGADQFAAQGGQIVDGAERLASGGDDLVSGHGQLLNGESRFGSGLRQYADGSGSFADGLGEFSDGLGTLADSGGDLSDGAETLRDETSDMDQQMTDRMNEALADFLPSDFDLVSFTDPRNAGIQLVQFVYLADAQVEPAEEAAEPEEEPEKSVWDRILDIFR